ncbi:MAG: DUF3604 domain-containing protein [Planctomycetaceae bacterium]
MGFDNLGILKTIREIPFQPETSMTDSHLTTSNTVLSNEQEQFGQVTLRPDAPLVAGAFTSLQLVFHVGKKGIATGGGFRVYTDSDSDWGTPQFVDSQAAEYCTMQSPPGVATAFKTTGVKSFQVIVKGRNVKPGETFIVTLGDQSQGSPGTRVQTFAEQRRYFWVDVDSEGSGNWRTLSESPAVQIVADEAVKLNVTIPSMTVLDEEFRTLVKAEDRWGNPVDSFRGQVRFQSEGIEVPAEPVVFTADNAGARWVEGFKAKRIGVLQLSAHVDELKLSGNSNPQVCTKHAGEYSLKWADPHGGQLVMNSKIAGFFRYARDVSGVQFVGYQRNADVISNEDWEVQQREECAFYERGVFVPIPGFEWSGKTWEGGHHNVYFRRHGMPVRRNFAVEEMFQADRAQAELGHIRDVYAAYRNTDTMLTPHVGGEHSDLTYHDPTLEPAVEISSSHGSFEWMIDDVFDRGYRMGFLGGSDCYTGRPGDDRPGYQQRRYSKSGLTGIFTKDISLESFFEAMRARRVYATTGARIILSIDVDGHPMGSHYTTNEPSTLAVAVAGTAPLESLELYRNKEMVYSHPLEWKPSKTRVRIRWNGSSRMTSYSGIIWDGIARFQNATVKGVETIRFDSPRSHIFDQHDDSLRFHAWGCGYPQGVLVELEEGFNISDAELHVSVGSQTLTGPLFRRHGDGYPRRLSQAEAESGDLRIRLSDLNNGPVELELGVLNRKVTIDWAPEGGSPLADFLVREDDPLPGINAYWMKVLQVDGEMAWSSPVYADFVAPVGESSVE